MAWLSTTRPISFLDGRGPQRGSAARPACARPEQACYGLEPQQAEAILREVEDRYLPPHSGEGARSHFRAKLHVEELMLARGCARGDDAAWEEFWRRYQGRMRAAARSLTHEEARANDLADGLFAELFGLRTREGARISKLNSYTGIGSLEGWLCALLAQAHVDEWRRERRWVGLEEDGDLLEQVAAAPLGEP